MLIDVNVASADAVRHLLPGGAAVQATLHALRVEDAACPAYAGHKDNVRIGRAHRNNIVVPTLRIAVIGSAGGRPSCAAIGSFIKPEQRSIVDRPRTLQPGK